MCNFRHGDLGCRSECLGLDLRRLCLRLWIFSIRISSLATGSGRLGLSIGRHDAWSGRLGLNIGLLDTGGGRLGLNFGRLDAGIGRLGVNFGRRVCIGLDAGSGFLSIHFWPLFFFPPRITSHLFNRLKNLVSLSRCDKRIDKGLVSRLYHRRSRRGPNIMVHNVIVVERIIHKIHHTARIVKFIQVWIVGKGIKVKIMDNVADIMVVGANMC